MNDEIKPSKKRVKKNFAALRSLIESEGSSMTKRKFKLKPLVAAAAIIIVSAVSLFTVVDAAPQEIIVKFTMGGEEIEGKYCDYVDNGGVRHICFSATDLPIDEKDIAVIYDVDAPQGENVRVLTNDTDPDFFESVRSYVEAGKKAWEDADKEVTVTEDGVIIEESTNFVDPDPEDFGLVFKDNEYCTTWFSVDGRNQQNRDFGGYFIQKCEDEGKPANYNDPSRHNGLSHDYGSEIYTFIDSFYYYVGKE